MTLQYRVSRWILNNFHIKESESINFRWAVLNQEIVNCWSLLFQAFPLHPSEFYPHIHGFPWGTGDASTKWKTTRSRHSESALLPKEDHKGFTWFLSVKRENRVRALCWQGKHCLWSHEYLEGRKSKTDPASPGPEWALGSVCACDHSCDHFVQFYSNRRKWIQGSICH